MPDSYRLTFTRTAHQELTSLPSHVNEREEALLRLVAYYHAEGPAPRRRHPWST